MPQYKLKKHLDDGVTISPQYRWTQTRAKIQVFGGGYGNGKTAAAIVSKVLTVAKDYPGCNILVARATYPKLNDTIRKEFILWCPSSWIKSFPKSKNSDNTCTLVNGSVINFRYIAQQGKSDAEGGQTTSNLLSATYDLIVVDQLEDPEITEKDFDDLLGRLRGNARYAGTDPTMPLTGPRWFCVMLNPTRNWCYRKLIAPYHAYVNRGIVEPELLCTRYPRDHEQEGQPVLDDEGKPNLIMELVEGSTYTNKHNLGADFIETLENVYTGQSRDRFLYGEWASYEGLVYPEFNEAVHMINESVIINTINALRDLGVNLTIIEGYDYGIVMPSCYLLGCADRYKNVFILDGFYTPSEQMHIEDQQAKIHELRDSWGFHEDNHIICDPAIMRRSVAQKSAGAKTIAQLFGEGNNGVKMRAGDNDKLTGITKVSQYIRVKSNHRNPFTQEPEAPHLYINDKLQFIASEMSSWYWKADKSGKRLDEPVDKNDHSLDTIKYMLSRRPSIATRTRVIKSQEHLTQWSEGTDL